MNNNTTRVIVGQLTDTLLDEVELIEQMISNEPFSVGELQLRVKAMNVVLAAVKDCVENI